MGFKITNALSEEDYETIVGTLSDKKALDDEERHSRFGEDIAVKILGESQLDLPLATVGERWDDGQIFSPDAENYRVAVTINYESRENNFSAVLDFLRDKIPKPFTATFGKKALDLNMIDGTSYRLSCMGIELKVSTLKERKINKDSLKVDVAVVLQLTEWITNAIYELGRGEIYLELTARMRRRKMRSDLMRRRKWENAIKLEKPELTFQEIGGCSDAKSELTMLGHGLEKPESFQKWGIRYPRGILLHGPPGTGKTMLARAMANLGKASLFCVSVTDVLTCYYGESPKLISRVFDTAQKNAPSIILFDEIDSLLQPRSEAHEETVRIVSVFLQKMDGIKSLDKVVVIGTTNRLENIDHAMLRPGRFDKIIEVPPPDKQGRMDILKIHCKGKRLAENLDYQALAEKSDGLTGADLSEAIQVALTKKLREEITTGKEDISSPGTEDLLESIDGYRKRKETGHGHELEHSSMYA